MKSINEKAEKLAEFVSESAAVARVKPRSIALLCREGEITEAGQVTLMPMNVQNGNLVEAFRKKRYSIIAGERDFLERISPLEVFFIHRTDVIVAIDDDDVFSHDRYRSAFNSPVFLMDTVSRKNFYFAKSENVYNALCGEFFKKRDDSENLFSGSEDGKSLFFIADEANGKTVAGEPLLNRDNILIFEKSDGRRIAMNRVSLGRELTLRVRGIVNCRIVSDDGGLKVTGETYLDEGRVRESAEGYLKMIFERRGICKKQLRYELKGIWK